MFSHLFLCFVVNDRDEISGFIIVSDPFGPFDRKPERAVFENGLFASVVGGMGGGGVTSTRTA